MAWCEFWGFSISLSLVTLVILVLSGRKMPTVNAMALAIAWPIVLVSAVVLIILDIVSPIDSQ